MNGWIRTASTSCWSGLRAPPTWPPPRARSRTWGWARSCSFRRPRDLDRPEARALAYGAWDLLDSARVAPDLRSAVAGCTLVAATSARDEGRAATRTPREFAAEAAELAAGGRVAVVFGPEATGLLNDELALCQMRIRVPTHSAQPSLNLAQAVLLIAYELRLAALPEAPAGDARPARAGGRGRGGAGRAPRRAAGHQLPEPREPAAHPVRAARAAAPRRGDDARGVAAAGDGAADPLGGRPDCSHPDGKR